jgi:hypothetical protein
VAMVENQKAVLAQQVGAQPERRVVAGGCLVAATSLEGHVRLVASL